MAVNEPRNHIIAYDIGEPRRLVRIHRFLKKRAMPIQYSVFLIQCTPDELRDVIADLNDMIEPAQDDIRFYTLPRKPEIITLGRQGMMAGIQLIGKTGGGYENAL